LDNTHASQTNATIKNLIRNTKKKERERKKKQKKHLCVKKEGNFF
jgi:hypothetical protein